MNRAVGADMDQLTLSVQWSSISPLAHEFILWTSVDRKCFFYLLRLPSFWKLFMTFVQPVDSSVVGKKPGTEVYVASATVPWDGSLRSICKETCCKLGLQEVRGFVLKENGAGIAPAPSRPKYLMPGLGKFTSTTLSCRRFFPGAKPISCVGPFPGTSRQSGWPGTTSEAQEPTHPWCTNTGGTWVAWNHRVGTRCAFEVSPSSCCRKRLSHENICRSCWVRGFASGGSTAWHFRACVGLAGIFWWSAPWRRG